MHICLFHERTFARIAPALKGYDTEFDVILMDDEGRFTRAADGSVVDAPQPTIAYGTTDVWFGPAVRQFIQATLASDALDWFQSSAAGIDSKGLQMVGRKARLYTTNHRNAEAIGEWALWQALDWLKRGPAHRQNQADRNWHREWQGEIFGSHWLIIGYGALGEAIGRRVTALGGHVTGMRRSGGPAVGAKRIAKPEELHEELGKANIVVLSLPLTAQTEGMADAAFFDAMMTDSLFMNIGRGALVDEMALLAGLDAGKPVAAALDVTSIEPLPEDSPLWSHPAVSITPHDSGQTQETIRRADQTFLENLTQYFAGEPMRNVIDKSMFGED